MKNMQQVVDSNFDRIQARNGLGAKNLSQLNKLLPVLELAGKKEKDQELVLDKMKARDIALNEVLAAVDKTIKSLSALRRVDYDTQMKKLTFGIRRIQKIVDNKPPTGTSKLLTKAVNEITSIREGVYTKQEMKAEDYSLTTLALVRAEIVVLIKANVDAVQKHKDQQAGVDESAAIEERMYADFEQVLQSTKEEGSKAALDDLKTKPWTVVRAPVIPMPRKGVLEPQKFKRAGFNCDPMAGYPVFRSQLVIGISRAMLTEGLDEKTVEKMKGKPLDREALFKLAVKVRRILEKKTGQKLFFVEERAHGAAGGSWFWLMTEREINAFAACCPGGSIQLLQWGFAF